jgi:D-threo-aldose 1-dehydrogenase
VAAPARRRLALSQLGLGSGPLGLRAGEAHADREGRALVRAAIAHGLRYFDTAPLYGCGFAERCVGGVLRERPRDTFVLSTKVGRLVRPSPDPTVLDAAFDFSADGVHRSLEESLERLGLDHVDIVLLHDPDDHFGEAVDGALPELMRLRDSGLVDAVGVGMNQAAMLVEFVRRFDLDCVLVAGRYTLLDQTALERLLPLCLERGVAVIVGAPYNGGVLARAGSPAVPPALRQSSERWDVPLKAAAIQFPLSHPAVTSVLTGCRSSEELDENVRMLAWPIPAGFWDELRAAGLVASDVPA